MAQVNARAAGSADNSKLVRCSSGTMNGETNMDFSGWVRDGKVKHRECVTEGLDGAPGAFMGLLKGANFGKQLVRVGPDAA